MSTLFQYQLRVKLTFELQLRIEADPSLPLCEIRDDIHRNFILFENQLRPEEFNKKRAMGDKRRWDGCALLTLSARGVAVTEMARILEQCHS